ncbi:MAG: bifunctional biotin--[acetyl-CoA-carboxylase] ligase/biotin operon repressor BirA [Gammaproteobacteria bacterium]|jgi:BirA family biotin operon repressor/biotin-[acetyl-CoA-carboxylase] ligase
MDIREHLIARLADGRFHSGQALADALSVSRTAVWKHVEALAQLGLEVQRVRGRGYRLPAPLDLLDAGEIRAELASAPDLEALEVSHVVDSTNTRLLDVGRELPPGRAMAFLAEYQRAGRGRRGRHWASPFGSNLYLSLAWSLEALPPGMAAFAMALGVTAARVLEAFGIDGVRLKWPNDLTVSEQKLGGLLVEMQGEPAGGCLVVAGIGLNVAMPESAAGVIDQPWTDLSALCAPRCPPRRNALAARLIDGWLEAARVFREAGFRPFIEDWRQLDSLTGRVVAVINGEQRMVGRARGIGEDGALLLDVRGEVRSVYSGEATLRITESLEV